MLIPRHARAGAQAAPQDKPPSKVPVQGEPVEAALAVIWPLLGRHIAFHRRLVDLTDSVKAALLLSQSIYWHRRGRDIEQQGGWFHKTAEQWTLETGLTLKEQQAAREQLRALSLLQDRRMGMPARLHFRLNEDELGRRLKAYLLQRQANATMATIDWQDRLVLAELLGPSVAFHRALAGLAGGVHGGLLLSRALHLMRVQARRDLAMWVDGSMVHWHRELGLSRRSQELARRELMALGVWEERLDGIPPSLWARVRLEVLQERLMQAESGLLAGCGNTSFRDAPNGETRVRESHKHVLPKPPSLFAQKRHHCSAETAIHYIKKTTSVLLQPQTATDKPLVETGPAGPPDPVTPCGAVPEPVVGGDFVIPPQLLPAERQSARQLLADASLPAQVLLDELAGRLQSQSVRHPLAYLRGLIQRAQAGTFVPELAPRIAAERSQRQAALQRQQQRADEAASQIARQAQPGYQQRVLQGRERARELLAEMKQSLGSARPNRPRTGGAGRTDSGGDPAQASKAVVPSAAFTLPVATPIPMPTACPSPIPKE